MDRQPLPGGSGYAQTVVAVFARRRGADEAARAASQAGIPASEIAVGRPDDLVVALHGQMREEIEHAAVGPGPPVPALTREMARGVAFSVPIGIVIGVVLVTPFGFIPFGGIGLVLRLVILAAIGAVAGATAAMVLGGGFSVRRPGDTMAAERGVTLHISCRDPEEARRVAALVKQQRPIRVDLVTAFDQPVRPDDARGAEP